MLLSTPFLFMPTLSLSIRTAGFPPRGSAPTPSSTSGVGGILISVARTAAAVARSTAIGFPPTLAARRTAPSITGAAVVSVSAATATAIAVGRRRRGAAVVSVSAAAAAAAAIAVR